MASTEMLSIRVTKAIVSEPSKTTHYVLTITNPTTQAMITTRKRHRDFKRLQKDVMEALHLGHQCTSVCPWFYMDIQQKMPRPNPLSLFSHGKVITQRIRAFQVLLDTIVAFIVNPASQLCSTTCDSVPKALYNFLFEDLNVQDSMYLFPHSSNLSSSSSSSSGSLGDSTCSLCTRYLSTNVESNSCISTLSCGHVFHDECIVQALNVSLECPCCHQLKEVLGLFLSKTPQEMTIEDGEAVEDAIIRLRLVMKTLPNDTPLFWSLKYTNYLRELLQEHLTDTINSFVDEEMSQNPQWMIVSFDKKLQYVDLVLDKMVMKYATHFHQLQMIVHGEVAGNVQLIMQQLLKVNDIPKYFEKYTLELLKSKDEVRSARDVERYEVFSMNDDADEDGSFWTGREEEMQVTKEQIKMLLENMTHSSNKVRVEAFNKFKVINAEVIIENDNLTMVVQRLIPFMLDKDDTISTDAVRHFYNLFIETHDIATQCQLYITLLQILMYSTPRTALFLRKPSISSAAPSQTSQRGLLRLLRCLQTLLLRLPNEWIYVPIDVQAKVYLVTAQFFGPWSPPNIVITEPNLTGNTAEWIPPYSIMACLDMTAEWFSRWYLKCSIKPLWIELLAGTGVVQHCIHRIVFGHEAMELWRKFTRHTMSPAGVTYRRRSISRAALTSSSHVALDSPSPLPNWYTTLMQKSMIQVEKELS
ncbi:hypothetical protein THRCLA_04586 [Thraustotheca clavata]|uniref:RING-type domain-containing protein n=1 Tax=Thraustotheca clavata TaxID=74557 RepID=A0A1V9ZYL6_9STRA|nr:hypothetical protein THRCLA_04586 [Thraustotheca clavata]